MSSPSLAPQKPSQLFDGIAREYDAARPSYPDAVVERIVEYASLRAQSRLLEVGTGTGKATLAFAARGFRLLGLEPGANLAELARARLAAFPHVEIRTTSFEAWNVEVAVFDLVFVAQTYHWLDAVERTRRLRQSLPVSGALAVYGNATALPAGPLRDAIHAAHGEHAVALLPRDGALEWYAANDSPLFAELGNGSGFADLEHERFEWNQQLSASAYCGLLATYSRYLALPTAELSTLLSAVEAAVNAHGREVRLEYTTGLFLARAV